MDGELTVGKTKFVPMPTASEGLNMYARMGNLASKVTAALGSEVKPVEPVKPIGTIKVGDLVTITGSTYYGGNSQTVQSQ